MDIVGVLIADDHPLFREGMRGRLDRVDDIAVVEEAESGDEAAQLAHKLEPDVILMAPRDVGVGERQRETGVHRLPGRVGARGRADERRGQAEIARNALDGARAA
jgi:DNA-binding NarL/FixJ family response regulator